MFGLTIKIEDTTKNVAKAADKAAFKNFGHAATSIRKDVISTIEKSAVASLPGTPPHTRRKLLPNAIRFDANKEGAVIGPLFSRAGLVGQVHEFGGSYKGQDYPERPYMLPALERAAPRFAGEWTGSIGQ